MEEKLFVDEFEGIESMRARGVFNNPNCLLEFLYFVRNRDLVLGHTGYVLGIVSQMLDAGIDVNACTKYGNNALIESCGVKYAAGLTHLLIERGGLLGVDTVGFGFEELLYAGSMNLPSYGEELELVGRFQGGDEGVLPELERINMRTIVSYAYENRYWYGCHEVSMSLLILGGLSCLGVVLLGYVPGLESYAGYMRGNIDREMFTCRSWLLGAMRSTSLLRSCRKFDASVDRYVYCANSEFPALRVHCRKDGKYELGTCGGETSWGLGTARGLNASRAGEYVFYDRVEWRDTTSGRMLLRCYLGDECEEIELFEGYREPGKEESVWSKGPYAEFPESRRWYVRYRYVGLESIESMRNRGVCSNELCMVDFFHFLYGSLSSRDSGIVPYIVGVIDYFVGSGIDVNAVDSEGYSALYRLFKFGEALYSYGRRGLMSDANLSLLADKLLSCGAIQEIIPERGSSLLHLSCKNGLLECTRVLLRHGGTLDANCFDKLLSVDDAHELRLSNQLELFRLLMSHALSSGIEIDLNATKYMTLLMLVCRYRDAFVRGVGFSPGFLERQRELVDLLLSHGASLHVLDSSGRSAIDHARFVDNASLVSYLESLW